MTGAANNETPGTNGDQGSPLPQAHLTQPDQGTRPVAVLTDDAPRRPRSRLRSKPPRPEPPDLGALAKDAVISFLHDASAATAQRAAARADTTPADPAPAATARRRPGPARWDLRGGPAAARANGHRHQPRRGRNDGLAGRLRRPGHPGPDRGSRREHRGRHPGRPPGPSRPPGRRRGRRRGRGHRRRISLAGSRNSRGRRKQSQSRRTPDRAHRHDHRHPAHHRADPRRRRRHPPRLTKPGRPR